MTKKTRVMVALGWLGCVVATGVGCQTWVGGMTLPSPDYLKDKPDYFSPAPQYKHARELTSMQRSLAETNPDAGIYAPRVAQPIAPAPVPQPVPAVPIPAVPPPGGAPAPAPAPAGGGAPIPMGPGGF
jgi:hypothetical protein